MRSNKSINNFVSAITGQVISLVCQLIIIKILTNYLSLEDFGLLSLIIIIPTLALPVVFCEVATSLNRFFFEDNKYTLYFNCIVYLVISFSFLFLITYLLKSNIQILLEGYNLQVSYHLVLLALVNHLFIYLGSLNLSFFKINYQAKWYIGYCALAHLPKVILLFIYKDKLNLEKIFLIYLLCHTSAFLITSAPLIIKSHFKFSFKVIKKLLSYSIWLTPGSYFGAIINSCDRIFIKSILGITQVGVYAIGYKIGDLIRQFFITAFSSVLTPVKFNTKTKDTTYSEKMNNLFIIYSCIGLLLCLLANSIAKPLVLILSNSSYLQAVIVVPLILTAHIIWGANDFLNSGYLLKNKTKITSFILLVGALLNLLLNAILIPKFGLLGACLSTAIAYLTSLPISYICSNKYHFLRFKLGSIISLFFIYLLLGSVQTWINLSDQGLGMGVIYNLSISLFFAIIIYINQKKLIKHILKNGMNK